MQNGDRDFLKKAARICGINLGILLLYSAAMWMTCKGTAASSIDFMLPMSIVVGLQVVICLCIALVYLMKWEVNEMLAYGLSVLVVVIVGFSFCGGGGNLLPHGF